MEEDTDMWYHGTGAQNSQSIYSTGFSLPKEHGIWGVGVYFANSRAQAEQYGTAVLAVHVSESDIIRYDYREDMPKLFKYLAIDEEEGDPGLREHVLSLGKKGVVIRYEDGDLNLVAYDVSIVTVQR